VTTRSGTPLLDRRPRPAGGVVTAPVRHRNVALVTVQARTVDGGELACAVLQVLEAHAVPAVLLSVDACAVQLTVPRAEVPSVRRFLDLVITASQARLTVDEDAGEVG
jgi:hypothetical protein